jgi:hypothetical protein
MKTLSALSPRMKSLINQIRSAPVNSETEKKIKGTEAMFDSSIRQGLRKLENELGVVVQLGLGEFYDHPEYIGKHFRFNLDKIRGLSLEEMDKQFGGATFLTNRAEKKSPTDRLDKLTDRLNRRLRGGKIKSKLVKKKKVRMPGFSYWFNPK